MKSLICIAFSLWAFCGVASTIEITEALKLGKIKVTPTYQSLGQKGMLLTIKNNGAQSLTIAIPGGTTFTPPAGEQVLMNVEDEILVLGSNETKKIYVGGYCTQLGNVAPRLESNFKIDKTTNKLLLSLLDFLKTNNPHPNNYQAAIWALTDNSPIADIVRNTADDNKMREHIAKLTKRENPWNANGQQLNVVPGRPIQRNTVDVKGNLDVTLQENANFDIVVVDSQNEEKLRFPREQSIQKNIPYSFRFSLSVQGWEVGTYRVILKKKTDGSTIASFDFQV